MQMVQKPLVATSKTRWAIGRYVPPVPNAGTSAAAESFRLATGNSSAPR